MKISSEIDQLFELAPLYVNGRLSGERLKAFRQAMKESELLRREVELCASISRGYEQMASELCMPSDELFGRIDARIDQGRREACRSEEGIWSRFLEKLRGLIGAPWLSWGLVVAQAAVIVLMLSLPMERKTFSTLSQPVVEVNSGPRINVVFSGTATEAQIRALLNRVGAQIVSGPTPEGLYVISIRSGTDEEKALRLLRESNMVGFAAESY